MIKIINFVLCSLPAVWLAFQWNQESLGVNPLAEVLARTGYWSLIFLIITLSVALVRRLSRTIAQLLQLHVGRRMPDWNWIIRLRRQWGLFTFFYALLHFCFYFQFETGFDWLFLWDDIKSRSFILSGMAALILLFPLTITSNRVSMKSLGRYWKILHRLVYAIALLVVHHVWTQAKVGEYALIPYCIVLLVLLTYRLYSKISVDAVLGFPAKPRIQRVHHCVDKTKSDTPSSAETKPH